MGRDLGRFASRVFALAVDFLAGRHVLASRATDAKGNVQPKGPELYGGNSHKG